MQINEKKIVKEVDYLIENKSKVILPNKIFTQSIVIEKKLEIAN